jgi:hypothetical protein
MDACVARHRASFPVALVSSTLLAQRNPMSLPNRSAGTCSELDRSAFIIGSIAASIPARPGPIAVRGAAPGDE